MTREIRGATAAKWLGTQGRQVHYWLASGQLDGWQDAGGRWWTTYEAVLQHLQRLEAQGRRVAPMRERFIAAVMEDMHKGDANLVHAS